MINFSSVILATITTFMMGSLKALLKEDSKYGL